MLDRFPSAAPLILLGTALNSGCAPETREIRIRASACLDAFQEGKGESDDDFTLTLDSDSEPLFAHGGDANDGALTGFIVALEADSRRGVEQAVDVEALADGAVQGVAYEGSLWDVDPTTAHTVVLSAKNPDIFQWEDIDQGLYAGVDMASGQAGETWELNTPEVISVSFLTHDCTRVVENLTGDLSLQVLAAQNDISYLN